MALITASTELASEATDTDYLPVLDGELIAVDAVPVKVTRCPLCD
jgi:hypothetical protein